MGSRMETAFLPSDCLQPTVIISGLILVVEIFLLKGKTGKNGAPEWKQEGKSEKGSLCLIYSSHLASPPQDTSGSAQYL